jgi:serine/threonine protein phosphatase 1
MLYAIADIHGCLHTLQALLEKVGPRTGDTLYFLGDYIDRGKNSGGVLDFLIALPQQGFTVHCLRGNHEENLLYAHRNYNPMVFQKFVGTINKSPDLLDEQGQLIERYLYFIETLPYYFELEHFWLVHAGFNMEQEDFLSDKMRMLETRRPTYHAERLKGKTVLHGHKVHSKQAIIEAVTQRHSIIPLDNGCVYTKPHKIYNIADISGLCCLRLDDFELFWQQHIG